MSFVELKDILSKLSVNELPKISEPLVTVSTTESFEAAFSKIVKANVQSAPVKDESSAKLDNHEKLNNIDDLLKLSHTNTVYPSDGVTVSYMARRNPFVSLSDESSVYDVIATLKKPRTSRVHRVAIVNKDGKVVNVVSQMTLVCFLAPHLDGVKEISDKTIKELKVGTYPALTMPTTAQAIDVFAKLDQKHLSGLAITDSHGRLTGNISGRDLKQFVSSPQLRTLHTPIGEFLNALRQEEIDIKVPAINCMPSDTFSYVAKKLAATRVHRLYVVDSDEKFKVIGVISLTDIIKKLFES